MNQATSQTSGTDTANLLMPREGESWDDLRRRLAVALNLGAVDSRLDLAPSEFVNRMIQDDDFAHLVLSSRSSPAFLKVLLDQSGDEGKPPSASKHSDTHLVMKAARSFTRWAKNGFSRVDEATFKRRTAACLACDHLAAPPDQLLYKIATAGSDDRRICRACGCVANRKARVSTENCPLAHPDNPLLSRWGEPRTSH